jgi:hypothetical protein
MALSDGEQAVPLADLRNFMEQVELVAQAVGRGLV